LLLKEVILMLDEELELTMM